MEPNRFKTFCILHTECKKKMNEHKFIFDFMGRNNGDYFDIQIKKRPECKKPAEFQIEVRSPGLEFIAIPKGKAPKNKVEAKKFAEGWAMRFCRLLDLGMAFDVFMPIIQNPNGQIQAEDGKIKVIAHVEH